MTSQQIVLFSAGYLVEFAAVVYFSRATLRRVLGSIAGGVAAGLTFIPIVLLGEKLDWWHVPFSFTAGYILLFYLGTVVSLSPIYLITWRVARRFGGKGVAICLVAAAVIGPPRDYFIASMYPEWMVFSSGVAPILADAAAYVLFVALGHGVMRAVSGPADADALARSSRKDSQR